MAYFIHFIVIKLDIGTILYSQPVSHSMMHKHIVHFYVITVIKVHYIIVPSSQYDFTITSVVPINLKASYYNVVVSRTTHLLYQGFHRRPSCIISKLDNGSGISFKNSITAN